MNQRIAKLGMGLLVCYLALFAMVNYVQVAHAPSLNTDPLNTRALVRDFDRPRGQILSADGVVLAESLPAPEGDRFEFQRVYPTGDLFAHTTGFLNFNFGADGAERAFNDDLAGQTTELEFQSVSDLFVDRERVGDVTLTLRADVQEAARNALGQQRGSVAAVDPRTGAVLALWSFPSFDPNALSTHDQAAADANRAALDPASQQSPIIPAAYRKSFFPGSTFKVVTGAIGVEGFGVTDAQPAYPSEEEFDIDFTEDELSNFGGSTCGGALFDILRVSCNSAFAHMGVETIGEAGMIEGAERFGFNERPPFDLPAAATSTFPTDFADDEGNGPLARASIGQGNVSATPLQMAMVVGALAGDGAVMVPHVLDRVTDDRGEVVRTFEPSVMTQAVSPATAATMREAMVGVVESGSGQAGAIDGFVVGGKTGTAQLGTSPPSSHAWFVAFAGRPGEPPAVAVAVIVEAQPGVSEVTGGRVAAPIARAVMEAALG
ncbi:MAG: penicillin-binding protein 2 [Acidimicrobiia bacterium]|nr:penicillin-binding protein 2 [Acidimicrobiia bacterium]